MKILVSACLVGVNCKYNGSNNQNDELIEFLKGHEVYLCCPEVAGGLSIPRISAEVKGNEVYNKEGTKVSTPFYEGAKKTLDLALQRGCKVAILKDGSPSCGSTYIYDGTFTGNKINLKGITVRTLEKNGIMVLNENNFKNLEHNTLQENQK